MLQDSERFILTTAKASLIRDLLPLVFTAAKSEADPSPRTYQSLEAFEKGGCDRMILELRRPQEPFSDNSPRVRKLRVSRLGRVLVVTGDAAIPEILHDIEAVRRSHIFPMGVASVVLAFVHTHF